MLENRNYVIKNERRKYFLKPSKAYFLKSTMYVLSYV